MDEKHDDPNEDDVWSKMVTRTDRIHFPTKCEFDYFKYTDADTEPNEMYDPMASSRSRLM